MSRPFHCASCPFAHQSSSHPPEGQLRLFENTFASDAASLPQAKRLREAMAPYLCLETLRRLATRGETLQSALRSAEPVPDEVQATLTLLSALLAPGPTETLTTPADFAALLLPQMGTLDHEEFWVICLDTRLHVQRVIPLYRGTVNSTALRASEVFRPALVLGSTALVVAHNHPGGSTSPSPDDIQTTLALREAGRILDIELVDHLIIAQGRWASLRELRQGW